MPEVADQIPISARFAAVRLDCRRPANTSATMALRIAAEADLCTPEGRLGDRRRDVRASKCHFIAGRPNRLKWHATISVARQSLLRMHPCLMKPHASRRRSGKPDCKSEFRWIPTATLIANARHLRASLNSRCMVTIRRTKLLTSMFTVRFVDMLRTPDNGSLRNNLRS